MKNKIHAKSCYVKPIILEKAQEFVDENHYQGKADVNGKYHCIGLFYKDDTLVGVSIFAQPRTEFKKSKYEYELLRMAFKTGITVYEGASTMIHYFEDTFKPRSFFTYQTLSGKQTDVYKLSGMKLIKQQKAKRVLVKDGYTYQSAVYEHYKKGTKYLYLNANLVRLGPDNVLGTNIGEVFDSFGEKRPNSWIFIHKCGYHGEQIPGDRTYEWINPISKEEEQMRIKPNSDLDIARDLYFRGFRGDVIKSKTGLGLRKTQNELKKRKIDISKDAIIAYQTDYIRNNYSKKEIIRGYRIMHAKYDTSESRRLRHIGKLEMLGCSFGSYASVLTNILGKKGFHDLKTNQWKKKQTATMLVTYGKKNYFQKKRNSEKEIKKTVSYFERSQTLFKHLDDPEFNAKRQERAEATNLVKYGTKYPIQNKQIAKDVSDKRQHTMLLKYGAANSVEIPSLRNKIFDSRTRNHTLGKSLPEEYLYKLLVKQFGKDDVVRQYYDKKRYPFHVDFYIKSRDLFIELNGASVHMDHWYDINNEDDVTAVLEWKKRSRGKTNSIYAKRIETWTMSDVIKRDYARKHKLHYLVFWDGNSYQRNGKQIPKLSDARAWIKDGCPDPENWRDANTY